MKNYQQRLNNIIGQLNGVGKMIEDNQDCSKVLIQLQASKSALSSLTTKYLEENAMNCLNKNCSPKNKKELGVLIKKLVENS